MATSLSATSHGRVHAYSGISLSRGARRPAGGRWKIVVHVVLWLIHDEARERVSIEGLSRPGREGGPASCSSRSTAERTMQVGGGSQGGSRGSEAGDSKDAETDGNKGVIL